MVGHVASTVRNQRARNIGTQFLRIPVHGMLAPTPGLGLPSSVNSVSGLSPR